MLVSTINGAAVMCNMYTTHGRFNMQEPLTLEAQRRQLNQYFMQPLNTYIVTMADVWGNYKGIKKKTETNLSGVLSFLGFLAHLTILLL